MMRITTDRYLRVAARWLCSLWLSLQFAAIAASPVWGLFVPHDHAADAATEGAWRLHWDSHHFGIEPRTDPDCGMQKVIQNSEQIISVLNFEGSNSLLSIFDIIGIATTCFDLCTSGQIQVWSMSWTALRSLNYVPPHPPPILTA